MKISVNRTYRFWFRRNRGLIAIYSIGAVVILLQLRSIL